MAPHCEAELTKFSMTVCLTKGTNGLTFHSHALLFKMLQESKCQMKHTAGLFSGAVQFESQQTININPNFKMAFSSSHKVNPPLDFESCLTRNNSMSINCFGTHSPKMFAHIIHPFCLICLFHKKSIDNFLFSPIFDVTCKFLCQTQKNQFKGIVTASISK